MKEIAALENDHLGIDAGYRHAPKHVTPGEPLEKLALTLKWYAVHPEDRAVPGELTKLARDYLSNSPLEARGFGFVILHRCGGDFYFLIVNTWRNNNELWETVFYKDGAAMAAFAPFPRNGRAQADLLCLGARAGVARERSVGAILEFRPGRCRGPFVANRSLRWESLKSGACYNRHGAHPRHSSC
jgi:hypothetical protein